MKRVRYSVAISLDGYIAGPNDESDWIIMDPDIDFNALMSSFDTVMMGRRTFESVGAQGGGSMPSMRVVVVSRTLRQEDYPKLTIVNDRLKEAVEQLRSEGEKDIWLFGGGSLFRSMLDAKLVDTVEAAVIPVLLGGGKPLLPSPGDRARLRLTDSRVYEKTGIVSLTYAIEY